LRGGEFLSDKEKMFWTEVEYQKFSKVVKSETLSYYAFEVLYWTGIRLGELLALTVGDFDFANKRLSITESKTENSKRIIELPDFLCREIQAYCTSIHKRNTNSKLFEVTKRYLNNEMARGCKESGVKHIGIYGIRYSYLRRYLITNGYEID